MALDGGLFFHPLWSGTACSVSVLAKLKIAEMKIKRKFFRQFMPSTSDDSHAGSRSAKVNCKWNAVRNYYQFRFHLRKLISSRYFLPANKLVNM